MPNPAKQLWKVTVTCQQTLAEAVESIMGDEALAVTVFAPPRHATATVEALYSEQPDGAELGIKLAVIAASHGAQAPQVEIAPVGNLDWLRKVAADFPPLPIARWTVYGAEHRHKISNHRLALQIDATSAFGTGEHPTTRGCLLMLDKVLKRSRRRNLLDVGCGSGILAMAFAKSCRGRAVAVDMDSHAVKIASENVRANGLCACVRTGKSFGYRDALARDSAPYDIIMANIFARPLCLMAKDLKRHLKPNGIAILSGLLNTQANAVIAAHRMQGLRLEQRMVIGEWTVLCLRR